MSDKLKPAEPRGIVVASKVLKALAWTSFRRRLEQDVFRQAVEDVVNDYNNMNGLERSPEYFRMVWPLIWSEVDAKYSGLKAQYDVQREKAIMESARRTAHDAMYEQLVELLGDAFGLTNNEQLNRIEVWIRSQPLPKDSAAAEAEYLSLCACERVEHYFHGESFQRVLLSRLPWLPRLFSIIRLFEDAQVGRFKPVFLYLWALFGDEITEDHKKQKDRRKKKPQPLEYVEDDARKVLHLYKSEEQQGKDSSTRISIHLEYGLLLAVVRSEIARRVNQDDLELQNFVADLHVPEIVRNLLIRETHSQGLENRHESRFFSEKAQCLINNCNLFLKGELAWQAAVESRIRRQMKDGALENWEILLEFEKHAERWQRVFVASQGS